MNEEIEKNQWESKTRSGYLPDQIACVIFGKFTELLLEPKVHNIKTTTIRNRQTRK